MAARLPPTEKECLRCRFNGVEFDGAWLLEEDNSLYWFQPPINAHRKSNILKEICRKVWLFLALPMCSNLRHMDVVE